MQTRKAGLEEARTPAKATRTFEKVDRKMERIGEGREGRKEVREWG